MLVDGDVELLKLETRVSRASGYCAHVALVDGLLVDTGFAHARRQLLAALEGLMVEQVVNTHGHEDHVGNNREVAERFGVEVRAPAATLRALAQPERVCVLPYQRVIWGLPSPSSAAPLAAEVRTRRFRFEVISTPGHSHDHVCLHEPDRGWLFTGDLYLGSQVRRARGFENGSDLIASLERVAAVRPRILFCCHRGPIENAGEAIQKKLRFLRDLCQKVRELARAGRTPEESARLLLGPDPLGYRILTSGDFSKEKLVRSFLKEPGHGYGEFAGEAS